jgi:predicted secreted protein
VSAEAKDKAEQLTYKLTSVEMETPCDGTYSFANATGGFGTWDIDNASSKEYSFADALPLSFNETGSVNTGSTYWNILPVTNGKIKFKVGYQVFQNGKMIVEFSGASAKTCEVENPNLVSGKRYVYNFLLTRGTENMITFTTDIVDWDSNATVTNKEPYDPTLTYVTYRDGTIRTYDLSGVIESTEESVYLRPTTMVENANDAVEVKIGNQVTEIGYKCFAGCRYLAKVEIPSSVTKLGTYAFSACYSLKDINFPEGLLEIDDKCFAFQNGWYNGAAFSH